MLTHTRSPTLHGTLHMYCDCSRKIGITPSREWIKLSLDMTIFKTIE